VDINLIPEIFKAWGPPALIAVVFWFFLVKTEKREEAKDKRIQMLENLLIESYDERIEAAERVTAAISANTAAMAALTNKMDGIIERQRR